MENLLNIKCSKHKDTCFVALKNVFRNKKVSCLDSEHQTQQKIYNYDNG